MEILINLFCSDSWSAYSPISSETLKLQETRQVRMGVDGQVSVKFVQSKILVRDNFDKGCIFSQEDLKRLTDLCQEEALGLTVYVVLIEHKKLPNVCLSFDLTVLELLANNMEWISRSIVDSAHKYFNSLPITWNGDKWIMKWMNARMICGKVNDSCIKKQLLHRREGRLPL